MKLLCVVAVVLIPGWLTAQQQITGPMQITGTTNIVGVGSGTSWPVGTAGIPNYNGANGWGTTYNASNPIPLSFLPSGFGGTGTPSGALNELQFNAGGGNFGATTGVTWTTPGGSGLINGPSASLTMSYVGGTNLGYGLDGGILTSFHYPSSGGTPISNLLSCVPPSGIVAVCPVGTTYFTGIGSGQSGTLQVATVYIIGTHPCQFDNTAVLGDYVVASTTVAGNCHDTGSSVLPGTGLLIGSVMEPPTSGMAPVLINRAAAASGGTGGSATGTVEVNSWAGVDPTGATDSSAAFNSNINGYCSSGQPPKIHFGNGTYTINSGILIAATQNTCGGLWLDGSGSSNTVLTTNCSGNSYGIWYNNTSVTGGDNLNGIRISNMMVWSTGGFACQDGIRLTQTARNVIENVVLAGFSGGNYSTGTISTSGSTVSGVGTTFTPAMAHGLLEVTTGGTTRRGEICGYTSSTSLTLCGTTFPGGNLAAGTSFAVPYGGRGITCDPGNSYSQYISIRNVYSSNSLFGFFGMGVGGTSGGCSRVSIEGKANYFASNPGVRLTDSVGVWMGKGSDTLFFNAAINNVSLCWGFETSHANTVSGDCENSVSGLGPTPVTTCNGGTALQSCLIGVEASSDTNGRGYANDFSNAYIYNVGNVFQFDNSTGAYQAKIFGDRTLSGAAYTNHFYFYGTAGCPGNGSGIPVIIHTFDCNHELVSQSVN